MESESIVSVDLARAARRSEDFVAKYATETIDRVVERYLKWLRLVAKHADRPLAPTADIDAIWHLHMQHPRAYAADCDRLFGDILDHDGGFGADPAELPVLKQVFAETSRLWAEEYGEPYAPPGSTATGMTKCTRNCVSRCWHACKTSRTPERGDRADA